MSYTRSPAHSVRLGSSSDGTCLLANLSPRILDLLRSRSGGWNRRGPTGGSAYGMPRYSDTPVAFDAACPSTGPLLVWTVWPTFHVPCREVALAAADAANSRVIPLIVLFMFKRHQTRPCCKWIEDLLTRVDSVAASSKDEKVIITLTLHCSFILYFMLLSNGHQNCRGDDAQLGPVGSSPSSSCAISTH